MKNSKAQKEVEFSNFTDSIFFKIRSLQPDHTTLIFLKKHAPFLIKENEGTWSFVPRPEGFDFTNYYLVIHNLELSAHPFKQFNEKKCRLEISTRLMNDELQGLNSIDVLYYFRELEDANKTYNFLIEKYRSFGSKEYYQNISKESVKFIGFEIDDYKQLHSKIQFKLYDNKFESYYILKISESIDYKNYINGFD